MCIYMINIICRCLGVKECIDNNCIKDIGKVVSSDTRCKLGAHYHNEFQVYCKFHKDFHPVVYGET